MSFSFLQVLADESPAELKLVLCSRQTPPPDFNTHSLKMQQQAVVLANEDLAFTREETREFFTRIRKIPLKAGSLDKIREATEGWVGGLILLTEILKKNPLVPADQFLSDGGLMRFQVEAFDYLGQEIFAAQSPEVQDLLVKCALVPFVDPELMRVLAGAADAEGILKDFVRRNLFVQESYEPGRGWIFRFHQLFREFLLSRFQQTVSEIEKAVLYQKAAVLFRNRGALEEAVYLFIQADEFAEATGIIKQIGMDLVEKGRIEDLSRLLGALSKSEDLFQKDPWLLLLFSLTRRWNEMHGNLDRFSCCLSLFEKAGDIKGVLLSLAYLLEASMICRSSWNSLVGLFEKAEGWLSHIDPDSYPEEKAYVWLNMGLSQVLFGNARKGYLACQNAYRLAKTLKNPILECRALGHSLEGLSILGEYKSAENLARQLEESARSIKDIEPRVWAYAAAGLFNTFTGNRGKAYADLSEARRLISENGLFYFHILLLTLEIIWQGFFGSLEEAESKAEEVVAIAESLDNDFIKGNPRVLLGFSFYKAGRYEKATELFSKALEYVSTDRGYSESRLYGTQVVQGLINHHLYKTQETKGVLEGVLEYARAIKHYIFLVDIHLGLALIQWDQGDKTGAAEHVRAGLAMAREKDYYYSFLLSPKDVVKGCLLAFELGIEEVYLMARELLTNRYTEVAESELLKTDWTYSTELQSEKQETASRRSMTARCLF